MLVCKRSPTTVGRPRPRRELAPETIANGSRLGDGGPVFLPRRKPSAIGENLLAHADEVEPTISYDELWLAGRPAI